LSISVEAPTVATERERSSISRTSAMGLTPFVNDLSSRRDAVGCFFFNRASQPLFRELFR
jgi:hypothetical protein